MVDTHTDLRALRREVAVVIPCYNAGPRLEPVVTGLREWVDHIVVVDDGSTDGAPAALTPDSCQSIRFSVNRGKGHALLTGFDAALAYPEVSVVAVVDADGQHDPRELPTLYTAFVNHQADLVIGARRLAPSNAPWKSRFGNRLTATITGWLLGEPVEDTQSGYRLHGRRFAEAVLATVSGGRYETEMEILIKALREDYRIASVPIATLYEPGNPSSHFHALRDSVLIYRRLFAAARRRHPPDHPS